MHFLVRGEFVEANIAGKPMEEAISWIEAAIHPSLEMLDKATREKKISGGLLAGVRAGAWIMEASSGEEIGKFLRDLPFWAALKWDVVPLQSFASAIEQDKAAFSKARAAAAPKGPR